MTSKELVKLLEQNGWILVRHGKGGHQLFGKGEERVVVPFHGIKELKKGTLHAILKKAGLK